MLVGSLTQRVCCIYLNFIFILYIKLVSLFTVTVDRVPRAPLDVSRLAASAVEAPLEKEKPFKELPNCHSGGPKYWERNDTRRRDFAVAARATKFLIGSCYTAGQHTTGPSPYLPYPTSSELEIVFRESPENIILTKKSVKNSIINQFRTQFVPAKWEKKE